MIFLPVAGNFKALDKEKYSSQINYLYDLLLPSTAGEHTILDILWLIQSLLHSVFHAIDILSRSGSVSICVYGDVYRIFEGKNRLLVGLLN